MEKINIAEILKDCPSGMELDCTLYDDIVFDSVSDWVYPIKVITKDKSKSLNLTKYGGISENENAKCLIFPKGKTTWEGFQRPFKDGDVLCNNMGSIHIHKGKMRFNKTLSDFYCGYRNTDKAFIIKKYPDEQHFGCLNECRFATEEEKQKLFDAIKANGYKWNPETKTLEKLLKFKVRDRVKHKDGYFSGVVTEIDGEYFRIKYDSDVVISVDIRYQDEYELVSNKFDITTLKPFESRVLVRDGKTDIWNPAIWGCLRKDRMDVFPYIVVGGLRFNQCIPYEGNEHLLGTYNDCEEFYKTWKLCL